MPERVLAEDWTVYDERKIRNGRDHNFFSCEESWEVDYLIAKIRKYKPLKTDHEIKAAISYCCRAVPGGRARKAFVQCVMDRLAIYSI